MGQRETAVQVAAAQIGINPGGDKFWQYMGYTHHVEWCASFMSWVMNEAGLTSSQWTQSGGVLQMYNGAVSRGEIISAVMPVQTGDVVFFEWRNPGDGPDHVGIVQSVNGDNLVTIEGNILVNGVDNVGTQHWTRTSSYVWAIARPAYTSSSLDPWHRKAAAAIMKRRRF